MILYLVMHSILHRFAAFCEVLRTAAFAAHLRNYLLSFLLLILSVATGRRSSSQLPFLVQSVRECVGTENESPSSYGRKRWH